MPSVSYFASAFKSASQFESAFKDSSKKRKRDAAGSENDPDEHLSAAYRQRTLGPGSAVDRQASGRAVADELSRDSSGHTFPHRSREHLHSRSPGEVTKELAVLKPPLLSAKGPIDATAPDVPAIPGLRQRHLTVLTTILHKCLLEGDYIRAGRAWGMLLRVENSGHTMDLRTNDRWGIGAEILLRRDVEPRRPEKSGRAPNPWFSAEGFERAKTYYERLVLQYPYRKVAPNAIGPQDFYIAMFGLWICSTDEQHSARLADIEKATKTDHRIDSNLNSESESEAESISRSDMQLRYSPGREQIRKDTLGKAEDIATHLKSLLASPPYTDDSRFWKLHGMVALWIADLCLEDLPAENNPEVDSESGTSMIGASASIYANRDVSSVQERRRGQRKRQNALAEAETAFRRLGTSRYDPSRTMQNFSEISSSGEPLGEER